MAELGPATPPAEFGRALIQPVPPAELIALEATADLGGSFLPIALTGSTPPLPPSEGDYEEEEKAEEVKRRGKGRPIFLLLTYLLRFFLLPLPDHPGDRFRTPKSGLRRPRGGPRRLTTSP